MRDDAVAKLASSALSPKEAASAGVYAVDNANTVHRSFARVPALVFPYLTPTGEPMTYGPDKAPYVRVRYLRPVYVWSGGQEEGEKKLVRYAQPPASGLKPYFPYTGSPEDWPAVLGDPTTPLVMTEGELKGLCSAFCGVPTIGLGGVWNFADKDGRLLPELAAIKWQGRTVYIAYDSDSVKNPQVAAAEARLMTDLMQRGARPCVVRIPPGKDEDAKRGIDDLVEQEGAEAWEHLLTTTPRMTAVERAVVALNEHIAWIEFESKAFDTRSGGFISRDALKAGSRYAALSVAVPLTKGKKQLTMQVQTASAWLTHPYAQRYDDILFRPGQGVVVEEDGKSALNLWKGYATAEGDVQPFLDLTEYLFSRAGNGVHELILNLMTYKAQNPGHKIPLAIVLIGPQGCGKSLWTELLTMAFAPYGTLLGSSALTDQYQGWLEQSLIVAFQEVESADLFTAKEKLRGLISDETAHMNEKFRKQRQIKAPCLVILTSNNRAVGAYAHDDRRMTVCGCPPKREKAFYAAIRKWKDGGGPKALMGWFLERDLKGWTPPVEAPMTAEKYMSYMESLSPVQQLAARTKDADMNMVATWLDSALEWATSAELSGDVRAMRVAEDIKRSIHHMPIRPFYSAEELALIFPAITRDLFNNRKVYSTVAGFISRQLRDAGLHYLECADDPRGFKVKGQLMQFIVVADHEEWREPLTQAEFDRCIKETLNYGEYRKKVPRFQAGARR